MNRNEKAIGIALVMYMIYWAVYLAKGGTFCVPSLMLLEKFVGSLFTLLFFWMAGWILLEPDPDRKEMDGDSSGPGPNFDPFSWLAAKRVGVTYREFMEVFHDDTVPQHKQYREVRHEVKKEVLSEVYNEP